MDYRTKKRIGAALKISYGVARGVSALVTVTGHGLLGSFLKNRHMMGYAGKIAQTGFKAAGESVRAGLSEWEKA